MSDEPVRVELSDGLQGAKLFGELDLAVYEKFCAELTPLFESPGDVRLDLSEVEFIDSSAIRLFVRLQEAREGNGVVTGRRAAPCGPGAGGRGGRRSRDPSGDPWLRRSWWSRPTAPLSQIRRRVDAGRLLSPEECEDLKVAVTEACANAVLHSGTRNSA